MNKFWILLACVFTTFLQFVMELEMLSFLQIFIYKNIGRKTPKKFLNTYIRKLFCSLDDSCQVVHAYLEFFLQFKSPQKIFLALKFMIHFLLLLKGLYFSIWYLKISTEKLWGPNPNYAT